MSLYLTSRQLIQWRTMNCWTIFFFILNHVEILFYLSFSALNWLYIEYVYITSEWWMPPSTRANMPALNQDSTNQCQATMNIRETNAISIRIFRFLFRSMFQCSIRHSFQSSFEIQYYSIGGLLFLPSNSNSSESRIERMQKRKKRQID